MIVGAAVLPTAPLLVPGVAPNPDGVAAVRSAVARVRRRLPAAAMTVLVAAGPAGVFAADTAALTAVGLASVRTHVAVDLEVLDAASVASGYPLWHGEPLPLNLSVLALLLRPAVPVVAVAVPAGAGFPALTSVGAAVGGALATVGPPAVVVAAGDMAAGLSERAPLALVPGASAWDARVVAAVAGGRLDALEGLGPHEAARVGALGWAPLVALHGMLNGVALQPAVLHYSAPRGVGYLVADAR